jgi:hypothetical protein
VDWSKASEHFESVVIPMSSVVWRRTATDRRRLFHGTTPCRQRIAPFVATMSEDRHCDDCSAFHADLLFVLDQWVSRNASGSVVVMESALRSHIERFLSNEVRNTVRMSATVSGLYSKLENLEKAAWFIRAIPNGEDQALVIDVLYFARSNDDSPSDGIPFERLGGRFGMTATECEALWSRLEASLLAVKPDFMSLNFDREMMRRRTQGFGAISTFDQIRVPA